MNSSPHSEVKLHWGSYTLKLIANVSSCSTSKNKDFKHLLRLKIRNGKGKSQVNFIFSMKDCYCMFCFLNYDKLPNFASEIHQDFHENFESQKSNNYHYCKGYRLCRLFNKILGRSNGGINQHNRFGNADHRSEI